MPVFNTGETEALLPRSILNGMVQQVRTESTVARLSAREPMRFGNADIIIFNDFPKMEYVAEGANKSSTSGSFGYVTAKPYKGQVTMRFTDEVKWADEDYQLGLLNTLASAGATAMSRGLDLGIYHRINPLTGTAIPAWTNYVNATSNRVEIGTGDADDYFREAVGLLVTADPAWPVTGAAFDPSFSWELANLRRKDGAGDTSDLRYPQLGFGTNVTEFFGLPVAQGDTVSGRPEAPDTKTRAIVGDFQGGIRWGIQRELPVRLIEYGDPDGQGDLQRNNQFALRMEIVYGWYVFEDRFAVVEDAVI